MPKKSKLSDKMEDDILKHKEDRKKIKVKMFEEPNKKKIKKIIRSQNINPQQTAFLPLQPCLRQSAY